MKITKQVNGKTFVYYSETLEAFRHVATATIDALTSIHKTKETVAEARISWFIAHAETMRKPYAEDETLAMLATKQKDMNPAQLALYNALTKAWNKFKDAHSLEKGAKRGSAANGKAPIPAKEKAKDATPKAVNGKQADAYIRMQAAVLKAYAEKNRTILPDALRFAILEFAEAVDTVPVALSDEETK